MIAKAIAVTKDYVTWALSAMLACTVVLFLVSMAVKDLPLFLSLVGSLIGLALLVYYFYGRLDEQKFRLALSYVGGGFKSATSDAKTTTRIIHTFKNTGFLWLRKNEQYWVLICCDYKSWPLSEHTVLDEIRAARSAFRACGIEHVRIEVPENHPQEIIVACRVSQRWNPHFDAGKCKNLLTLIPGINAGDAPPRFIEGPLPHVEGGPVIEVF